MADITKINLNGTDLTIVDSAATSAIAGEIARAQGAESAITSALSAEVVARQSADTQLQTALSGKADTATTLAGYGITDAWTSAQTQSAITSATSGLQETLTAGAGIAISSANVISCTIDTTLYVVVSSLPAEPAPGNENKIHLVPDPSGETGNEYIEYLWKGDEWEKIGETQVETDLSDYWTSAETQSAITEAISEIVIPDPTILQPVSGFPATAETGSVVALDLTQTVLPSGFSCVEVAGLGEENDRSGIRMTVAFSAASEYMESEPGYLFSVNDTPVYAYQNEWHSEGVVILYGEPSDPVATISMYKDSDDAGFSTGLPNASCDTNYHYTSPSDENMVIDIYNADGYGMPNFTFNTTTQRGVYQKDGNNWVDITAATNTKIDNHIANRNNPHNVTAAQLGISASYSAQTETLILVIPTAS